MYTALSAQLAGELRHTHSRLAEFSEEVAFLGGEETEKMLVEREYATVMKHENKVLNKRWWFGCIEEGIIKWLWGGFGVSHLYLSKILAKPINFQMIICGIPIFIKLPGISNVDLGGRTEGTFIVPSAMFIPTILSQGS